MNEREGIQDHQKSLLRTLLHKDRSPKPGDTLENGASVILVKKIRKEVSSAETWLVLASWLQGQRLEYISWKYTLWSDGRSGTYAGRYTHDYAKALLHFQERS